MNNASVNIDMLIRYLDGELSRAEADRLEMAIREDPTLQAALDQVKATRRAVRSYAMHEQVKAVRKTMLAEEQAGVRQLALRRPLYRRSLAAAAILVLAFSMFGLYQYTELTPERLFAHSFQPYTAGVTRGADSSSLTANWQRGRPAEVVAIFGRLEHPSPKAVFLAANAYLSLHQPQQAIQLLQSLKALNEKSGTHYFEDDTDYYLAMSYLAAGMSKQAAALLDKIHDNPSHLYHDKVNSWLLWKAHHLH